VFLYDADEQDDADVGYDSQFGLEQHEGEQRTHTGGRKRGKNRDRMDEAFIQDAENNVDSGKGSENENQDGGLRILEGLRSALKAGMNGRGHVNLGLRFLDALYGIAER